MYMYILHTLYYVKWFIYKTTCNIVYGIMVIHHSTDTRKVPFWMDSWPFLSMPHHPSLMIPTSMYPIIKRTNKHVYVTNLTMFSLRCWYCSPFQHDPKMEVLYHRRPYLTVIFPFIGLTKALYMIGTSNLGSWNGHWPFDRTAVEGLICSLGGPNWLYCGWFFGTCGFGRSE